MKTFRLSAVVVALGLSAVGALAGEIRDTDIYADDVDNRATGTNSVALQHVGTTFGNGRILDSEIRASNAANRASGNNSVAHQDIGVATNGGTLRRVFVDADNARNHAQGNQSRATQEIGKVSNGLIQDTNIYADNAANLASGFQSRAEQKVGVAHDARLDFMGLPLLYTPWLSFPLSDDRKSGFLTPTIGSSGTRVKFHPSGPSLWKR